MSHVRRARSYARQRRWVTAVAGVLVLALLGAAVAAASGSPSSGFSSGGGNSLLGATTTTTSNLDTCSYNPTAAPKPGGGTVIFDENTVTRAAAFYGTGSTGHIGVFTNDESGLLIGSGGTPSSNVGSKMATLNQTLTSGVTYGTTTTPYPLQVTPLAAAVTKGDTIVLGNSGATQSLTAAAAAAQSATTISVTTFKASRNYASGVNIADSNAALIYGQAVPPTFGSGVDLSGRAVAPQIYLTDITANPLDANGHGIGDYELGGTAVNAGPPPFADAIYGSWSPTVGTAPVNKNGWILGPNADSIPTTDAFGGTTTSFNEGYGSEVVWNVSSLKLNGKALLAGHTYRVQSITHDTDQNHTSGGGDVGEVCTTISIPGVTTTASGGTFGTDGTLNLTDNVTVSGVASNATGKITVKMFGPASSSTDCSTPAGSKDVTLGSGPGKTNNDTYPVSFPVTKKGDYNFTADVIIGGVTIASSTCGAANEKATASPLPPTLTTDAKGPYAPTNSLTDTASLTGGTSDATGTITFTLFADDGKGGCGTQIGQPQMVNVTAANGGAATGSYSATVTDNAIQPGASGNATYHWTASYSGDDKNTNASSGCGADKENPVILYPHISIAKSPVPDPETIEGGTAGTFSITVTNDGNVDLTNVFVTDALSSDCGRTATQIGGLAKGASFGPYMCSSPTLTTANTTNDVFTNTAHTEGTAGNVTVKADDSAVITIINPAIDVTKSPAVQSVPLGGTANFTIKVTNIGDNRLTGITTGDGLAPDCVRTATQTATLESSQVGHAWLDPTESFSYTCSLGNVQAAFVNVITACGNDTLSNQVCDTDNNGGPPPPNCPASEANRCAEVDISGLTSNQDFKPQDTATLSGLVGTAGGTLTFKLYQDPAGQKVCDATKAGSTLLTTLTTPVSGNGPYTVTSASFLSALLGKADTSGNYNWQISYSGDTSTNNAAITGACGTENFQVQNG
jgi:uncharacterized repeat protein (TIGR01451 family)